MHSPGVFLVSQQSHGNTRVVSVGETKAKDPRDIVAEMRKELQDTCRGMKVRTHLRLAFPPPSWL